AVPGPMGWGWCDRSARPQPPRGPIGPPHLFPSFRHAPLTRAVVVVILGIDLAHRRLPGPLLVRVRDEARQAGDEEDRIAELVREPEVGGDCRNRAVDVHRPRPAPGIGA